MQLLCIDLKSPQCFNKKKIAQMKKSSSYFQLWAEAPRTSYILRYQIFKVPWGSRAGNSGQCRGTCLQGVLLQSFFCSSNYFYLVYRTTAAPVAAVNRCQMAPQNFYQKYDSTLQKSFLCQLSFLFCPGSLKMPINMFKLGLIIIQFISNLYGCVFL